MRVFRPTDNPITQDYSTAHRGYDFAGLNKPDEVRAGMDGEIIERVDEFSTNWRNTGKLTTRDYGNYIKVRHTDGSFELHAHLKKGSSFVVGTKVTAGQTIARIGNTGNSTGPHLHSEYRNANNTNVKAEFYMKDTQTDMQGELDKLREERDRNWRFFTGLCDILQVQHNFDIAQEELKKLITYEDLVMEKDKKLEEAQKKIDDLKANAEWLTKEHEKAVATNAELTKKVEEQTGVIEKQGGKIAELAEEIDKVKAAAGNPVLTGWRKLVYELFIKRG